MATTDELLSRKPKNKKEAERLIRDLSSRVSFLRSIKAQTSPSGAKYYLVEGERLTQVGFNRRIKNLQDRITFITNSYIENDAFATMERREADQMYPKYDQMRSEIRSDLQVLRNARNRARTLDEQENLDAWIRLTESKLNEFERFLPQLASGIVPPNVPKDYVAVDLERARSSAPTGQPAGQGGEPFTPGAGQGIWGETLDSGGPPPPPPADVDISKITTKEQARNEIARLRQRSNTLKGLIGETKNGVTLYYEVPGGTGMSRQQRDAVVANVEATIAALSARWFAETAAAPAGVELTGGLVPVVIPDTFSTPSSDIPEPLTADDMSDLLNSLPPVDTTPDVVSDTTSDVVSDTTPDVVSDTTPDVVSDTAPIATPTGPAYTDPATGVTYQPGETIGGEDRTLSNGGGVVNGIYIPPGIDYAWLGQQIPSDWEEAAKELYGGYYEMLKQVPELGRLLKEAFEKGWEPGSPSFQYALEQTDWWKTTTASARAWQEKLIRDPETARRDLDTRMALLRGVAQDMGITLSPEALEKLATDSIILNFQLTSQYEDVIGSEARKSAGGVSQLRYGFVGDSIRKVANKYGIALSDFTFNEWVDKIAVGAESAETFEAYASQTARNLYPSLTNGFERGLTFTQMTDPYAQIASRILEIPWAQVDFTDPKWAAAFTMRNDKGEQTQMSYGEWADYLRTTKSFGYEYTDEALSKVYTVVNDLAEAFGRA
jgi:hypothetical protein